MKFTKTLTSLALLTLLISCGENTTTSPLKDITAISLDETNVSIYATGEASLHSTVHYDDGSTADGSADMAWGSDDSSIIATRSALVYATANGGDANVTIDYASKYSDSAPVHVIKLLSINFSDLNISDVGNPQIISFSGNFENNETNVTMQRNITWSVDENATISEVNTTALTLTVDDNVTSIKLTATLFKNAENAQSFEKVYN